MYEPPEPDEPRVTAWRYVWDRGWAWKYPTADHLADLGLRAARIARWEGIGEYRVWEGYWQVHTWPLRIWEKAMNPRPVPVPPPAAFSDEADPREAERNAFEAHGVSGYEL